MLSVRARRTGGTRDEGDAIMSQFVIQVPTSAHPLTSACLATENHHDRSSILTKPNKDILCEYSCLRPCITTKDQSLWLFILSPETTNQSKEHTPPSLPINLPNAYPYVSCMTIIDHRPAPAIQERRSWTERGYEIKVPSGEHRDESDLTPHEGMNLD